jgi:apolipoprotein D and lipocalin family protein
MHTRRITTLLYLCSLAALAMGATTDVAAEPLATVETLDVPRYMGTWYEIAKFPNWFQKKCVANTKAEYSLNADGTVKVINRCTLEDGGISEATGSARQVGAATSPRLEVRFAPAWLAFIPAVWGDYWVIDLDSQYKLAAVSEPTRQYLWILSRTPKANKATYDSLLDRLGKKDFDLRNLEATPQVN